MAPPKRKKLRDGGPSAGKKAKIVAPPQTSTRITRAMTTNAPRQAVFNTAELLENILLNVPMKQLFVIQRVSKQYRDCIKGSIKLQERMWLRAKNVEKELWTLRPLEPQVDPSDRWTLHNKDCEFLQATVEATNTVMHSQALIAASFNSLLGCENPYATSAASRRMAYLYESLSIEVIWTHLLCQSGSWEHLLVTDPPCNQIGAYLSLEFNTEPEMRATAGFVDLTSSEPLTFKRLVKLLMETACEWTVHTRGKVGYNKRHTTLAAIISEQQTLRKRRGNLIRDAYACLEFRDRIFPKLDEWKEVRRKSKAIAKEFPSM